MLRMQIAFYGSTPAYRPVLEHHGWSELADELHHLSKTGAWQQMGRLVDDEIFDAFAFIADTPSQLADHLAGRYGRIVDRLQIGFHPAAPDTAAELIASLRDRDRVAATDS